MKDRFQIATIRAVPPIAIVPKAVGFSPAGGTGRGVPLA
jgi:hypothetical protein